MKKCLPVLGLALLLSGCKKDNETVYSVFTFETVAPQYLAGPTSYGENLYDGYEGTQYTGYTDTATGLKLAINYSWGAYNFWNGGTAISQWTDTTTPGFNNQCSVYATGGYNSSATFGVNNGAGEIAFTSGERVIDHIWVNNTTYSALSMKEGDDYSKKFSYEDKDWFLLTVTGYDVNGTATGTVDFYLADFRTTTATGIVSDWTKVELAKLGAVSKIGFSFSSSDVGEWGMNTPAYFCIDDIAVIAYP